MPLVRADGFAPDAIAVDPAAGCHVWLRACALHTGVPVASYQGRPRNLRRLVWERAGHVLTPQTRLIMTCGNPRCLAPEHIVEAPPPAPQPSKPPRRKRPHPLRSQLQTTLPPTKPAALTEREWTILVGIRDGRTLAAIGADLGLTRQRVAQIAPQAAAKLPPRRILHALTDAQLAAIAWADPAESTAVLARRLAAPYFTVHKARQRVRDAGGWWCALTRTTCAECGRPLLSDAAHPRAVHLTCEAARQARSSRERRARDAPGSRSTPFVAAWRAAHPERAAALRDREKAARRERWPDLPATDRDAILDRVHAADERDQPITRARADRSGQPWTAADDEQILARRDDPAREIAFDLGRTLWAVRHRRSRLLRQRNGDA